MVFDLLQVVLDITTFYFTVTIKWLALTVANVKEIGTCTSTAETKPSFSWPPHMMAKQRIMPCREITKLLTILVGYLKQTVSQ